MRYLKFAILGLCLSILPTLAQAQISTYMPPVSTPSTMIGIRAGLGIANEATPAYTNFTVGSRTGFLIGGQLDYWFSPMVAVSAQVLYDQKGDQLTGISPDNGYPETDDFTLNYLEIPILAKVALGSSAVKPYLFAGPSIGFLLGANDHQTQTQLGVDQTVDVSPSFSSMDLSLLFGAGISYQMASGMQIFGDAGYALGLVNVENTVNTGTTETLESRDIRIAAGLVFPLH
jgi:hypothetical protein